MLDERDKLGLDRTPITQSSEDNSEKVPVDNANICYFIFLLWGIGTLLPWNAILTALDFFILKLTGYEPQFVFPFAVNGMLPLVQILTILYGHKIPYWFRIAGCFFGVGALMLLLPIFANYLTPGAGFWICLLTMFIFSVFSGLLQGSVFGVAGMFPPKYIGAVMFGNGLSGITMNVLRAICLVIFPPDEGNNEFNGSMVYFIIAVLILIFSGLSFFYLQAKPFYIYYFKKATQERNKTARRVSRIDEAEGESRSLIEGSGQLNVTDNTSQHLTEQPHVSKPQTSEVRAFLIIMKNAFLQSWPFLASLYFVFVVTFLVFPGASNDTYLRFLNGIHDPQERAAWYGLIMVTIFNILDTIGRYLGGQPLFAASDRAIYILSGLRVIFIVTFFLIAYAVPPSGLFGDNADWFKIVNMSLFAMSNGYVSTQCCMKSPSRAHDDLKETVGILIGLSISCGILTGAISAVGIAHAVPVPS